VNGNLKLSDNNRKVELVRQYQPYPDHPDRFEFWQLLCKNGLTGRCYWEVEGEGVVQIAVTYRGISRTGYKDACGFGRNHLSWCLICFKEGFSVLHNQSRAYYRLPAPSISSSSSVMESSNASHWMFRSTSSVSLETEAETHHKPMETH